MDVLVDLKRRHGRNEEGKKEWVWGPWQTDETKGSALIFSAMVGSTFTGVWKGK